MKVMVKARFTLVLGILGRSSQKKCKSMQSPLKWQICLLVCAHSKVNLVRVRSGITALTRSPFCVTALFNLTLKALQKDHNAVLHIWLLSLWKYFFVNKLLLYLPVWYRQSQNQHMLVSIIELIKEPCLQMDLTYCLSGHHSVTMKAFERKHLSDCCRIAWPRLIQSFLSLQRIYLLVF